MRIHQEQINGLGTSTCTFDVKRTVSKNDGCDHFVSTKSEALLGTFEFCFAAAERVLDGSFMPPSDSLSRF